MLPILRSAASAAILCLRVSLAVCIENGGDGMSDSGEVALDLTVLGRHASGIYNAGGAEIIAFDPDSKRAFVVNASAEGGSANSVAVRNGVVAVAIEATIKTNPGKVVFYNAGTLVKISSVDVGALPDMLIFTPDGRAVLVANEGEPNAGFTAYNGQEATLRAAGVRIYGPGATAAQDLEPEYIAVAADSLSARVTLQEANALGVLDLSDRDPQGAPYARIRNWPVRGMYQPDGIAAYTFNGQTYYVTANEGDDRDDFMTGVVFGTTVGETARVSTLTLDPTRFPDATTLQLQENLGRLTVSKATGDTDGDGDYDQLHGLGSRSFSIWDGSGKRLFDSGSDFERITAQRFPANFNAGHTTNTLEDRSDNKGPEPEGVALGQIEGRTFAFIGLERIGGIMVYEVTNPQNAKFVHYINPRDFSRTPGATTILQIDAIRLP